MSGTLLQLIGLRGATTCPENSSDAIQKAVADLIDALVDRNDLSADRIISVTFSVTGDLNACFPAAVARQATRGWSSGGSSREICGRGRRGCARDDGAGAADDAADAITT